MSNLDTRNKRGSAINFDNYLTHIFPNPGTTTDVNYRQQIGMKYYGTLTASTATGVSYYRALLGVGV